MSREHSPADILAQYLIDKGEAELFDAEDPPEWVIYVDFQPPEPDELVIVNNTSGVLDARDLESGEQKERPGIQLVVRGHDHRNTYRKLSRMVALMNKEVDWPIVNLETSSYIIKNISATTAIGSFPQDDQQRYSFFWNAIMTIEEGF